MDKLKLTDEQINNFINDFPRLSREELMDRYNLTIDKYNLLRRKLNLKKRIGKMTEDEIEYIVNNYKTMSDKEIAKVLGRTANGIYNKRIKLQLFRGDAQPYVAECKVDREYTICIWWLTGASVEEIKVLYNRVADVNVEEALKNKLKMARAIRGIKEHGCFPIVRTEREIFNMSGLEVKLNDR